MELEENWGDEYVASKVCMLIFSRYSSSSDRANESQMSWMATGGWAS